MMKNSVSVGAAVSQTRLSSLLFSFALINLFICYKDRLDSTKGFVSNVLVFIGNNSFGIFFIHCIFRKFSNFIIPYFPFANQILPVYQVIQFVFMLLGSVVAMWIIRKVFRSKSGLLFGVEVPAVTVSKGYRILDDSSKCTGCSACMNICPHNAIKMVPDGEGFMRPLIDKEHCVECGLCRNICPESQSKGKAEIISAKAVVNKDTVLRQNSSSGGAFYSLAKKTMEQGGIVFGAGFDDEFNVKHQYIDSIEAIDNLMRSKYVQSDLNDSFVKVKERQS